MVSSASRWLALRDERCIQASKNVEVRGICVQRAQDCIQEAARLFRKLRCYAFRKGSTPLYESAPESL